SRCSLSAVPAAGKLIWGAGWEATTLYPAGRWTKTSCPSQFRPRTTRAILKPARHHLVAGALTGILSRGLGWNFPTRSYNAGTSCEANRELHHVEHRPAARPGAMERSAPLVDFIAGVSPCGLHPHAAVRSGWAAGDDCRLARLLDHV